MSLEQDCAVAVNITVLLNWINQFENCLGGDKECFKQMQSLSEESLYELNGSKLYNFLII